MKTSHLIIRVSPEMKNKYKNYCDQRAINPSGWIRLQIEKLLKDNESEEVSKNQQENKNNN